MRLRENFLLGTRSDAIRVSCFQAIVKNVRFRLLQATSEYLHKLCAASSGCLFIGVHIRRTDYAHHLGQIVYDTRLVNETFHLAAMGLAMEKMKLKHGENKKVVFVVASDDTKWAKRHIKNRVIQADIIF